MTTQVFTDAQAGDVERYLVLVRAEMLHLPPDDYLDVLDDVEAHVHAVAAEGGRLEERLGTPKQFVDELLTSMGTTGAEKSEQRASARQPRAPLDLDGWLPSQLTELGPDLRRGWWVIRGAAVPLALFGTGLAAIVLGTIGIIGSVKLGRVVQERQRLSALSVLSIIATIAAMIALPFAIDGGSDDDSYEGNDLINFDTPHAIPEPWIDNVYVFDESGEPLENVRLFDQDGQPLVFGEPFNAPLDTDGHLVPNVYPRFGSEIEELDATSEIPE